MDLVILISGRDIVDGYRIANHALSQNPNSAVWVIHEEKGYAIKGNKKAAERLCALLKEKFSQKLLVNYTSVASITNATDVENDVKDKMVPYMLQQDVLLYTEDGTPAMAKGVLSALQGAGFRTFPLSVDDIVVDENISLAIFLELAGYRDAIDLTEYYCSRESIRERDKNSWQYLPEIFYQFFRKEECPKGVESYGKIVLKDIESGQRLPFDGILARRDIFCGVAIHRKNEDLVTKGLQIIEQSKKIGGKNSKAIILSELTDYPGSLPFCKELKVMYMANASAERLWQKIEEHMFSA